jgi:hypothetical protein
MNRFMTAIQVRSASEKDYQQLDTEMRKEAFTPLQGVIIFQSGLNESI